MPTLEGATSFSPSRHPQNASSVARQQQHTPSPRTAYRGYADRVTPKGNAHIETRSAPEARDDGIPRMIFSPRIVRPGHQRMPANPPLRQPPQTPAPMSFIAWTEKGEAGSNWRQHFRVDSTRRSGTLSTAVAHTMAFSNLERMREPPNRLSPPRYQPNGSALPIRFQTNLQQQPEPRAPVRQEPVLLANGADIRALIPTKQTPQELPSPGKRIAASAMVPRAPSDPPNAPLSETKKRLLSPRNHHEVFKKARGFDKLDLLCSATLEMGALHDNPSGCSCPKSKCVALYCDCFKAGRRCTPGLCTCLDCKNTVEESGPEGARTKAIRSILARNPRAFTTAGMGNPLTKLPAGEIACNCVRSRCLKLYCSCFRNGKFCRPGVCTCVGCYNNEEDAKGHRQAAVQQILEKRPDAFQIKPREKGLGCACKNNRCIRKYCECFRNKLSCTEKCSCRHCENGKDTRT